MTPKAYPSLYLLQLFSLVLIVLSEASAESSRKTVDEDGEQTYECTSGSIWDKLGCISAYNGSTPDIALNYTAFVLNLLPSIMLVEHHKSWVQQGYRRVAAGCLVGVITFQFILCLILGCSGISIIWCAMGGWILLEHRKLQTASNAEATEDDTSFLNSLSPRLGEFAIAVLLLDLTIVIYYAVVAEAITTIAHICALVLGGILCFYSHRMFERDQATRRASGEHLTASQPTQ